MTDDGEGARRDMTSDESAPPATFLRKHGVRLLKWLLFALVVGFVFTRGRALWLKDGEAIRAAEWDGRWLFAAAGAYALGWLPSVWFWRKLMQRLGGRLSYLDTARAYYCGHLGKYVPGKASVVVIRAALIKQRGYRAAPAALTVTYETLVLMAAGMAVAVALGPWLIRDAKPDALPGWLLSAASIPWLAPLVVAVLSVALLPVVSWLFSVVAEKMTPRDLLESQGPVRIESSLLASGLSAFVAGWFLHGLSLGCTLCAVTGQPFDITNWPVWTAATSLATSVGFLAIFAPGGLGVREGLLFESLSIQPGISASQAIVAAVFLRLVWFVTEIVVAAVLYYTVRARPENSESNQ
jgi:hypothetical protein